MTYFENEHFVQNQILRRLPPLSFILDCVRFDVITRCLNSVTDKEADPTLASISSASAAAIHLPPNLNCYDKS
jgi:hypothetical protein